MRILVIGLLLICAGCTRPINQLNTAEVRSGSERRADENHEVRLSGNEGDRVSGREVREGNEGA